MEHHVRNRFRRWLTLSPILLIGVGLLSGWLAYDRLFADRAGIARRAPYVPIAYPTVSAAMIATDQAAAADNVNKTVFLIVMENHNWAKIEGSAAAPYINHTLLPSAAYARAYYNPPGVHPSEPNYLWLEAGTDFGVDQDKPPAVNHQRTTMHLVSLLDAAGISWRSYQEGISGADCPLEAQGLYAPKHNPMVFFDDVTDGNDPASATCIQHVRPYSELADDLAHNTVARYNLIVPNQCHDMHNQEGCTHDESVQNGDAWLAAEVPQIMSSRAYTDGGVIIITWDEGEHGHDGPIGLIVVSPDGKGGGYSNAIHYTHSSTLRTVQEIFGVRPLLGDAANAEDLSDLFAAFP